MILIFPDVRRDEIISYVAQKYGQLHAAQIITFGTLAAKAAVRDIGRVMGLSQREMEQFFTPYSLARRDYLGAGI
ncbi:hypothetical protein GCM10020331_032100 [Ectobacillus funiculus]